VNYNYVGEILLVEDNDVNQLVATKYLQRLGLQPAVASNGLEAIEQAKNKIFDLILMDLQMPEMNGYDATKAIRNLSPHYKTIPIIALTAAAYSEIRDKINDAQITAFIHKPFSPEDLRLMIDKYLLEEKNGQPKGENSGLNQTALIKKRLEMLAEGDASFVKELAELYVSSMRELAAHFTEELGKGDVIKLRDIRHKHKPNLDLLSLTILSTLLDEAKALLTNGNQNKAEVERLQEAIFKECDWVIDALQTIAKP
jgi:CheY-like chemotaxis protein